MRSRYIVLGSTRHGLRGNLLLQGTIDKIEDNQASIYLDLHKCMIAFNAEIHFTVANYDV